MTGQRHLIKIAMIAGLVLLGSSFAGDAADDPTASACIENDADSKVTPDDMRTIADNVTAKAGPSKHRCARAVNDGFKSVDKPLEVPAPTVSSNIASAKDYGPSLEKRGLEQICENCSVQPEKGDVMVIGPPPDPTDHPHPDGHIAVYNGQDWVSDFAQRNKEDGLGGAIPRVYFDSPTDVGDIPNAVYRAPDSNRESMEREFDDTATSNDAAAEAAAQQAAANAQANQSSQSDPAVMDFLAALSVGLNSAATLQQSPHPQSAPAPSSQTTASAIPPGWEACTCPNQHASVGRMISGTLYHAPGPQCK
jgi:hypothetical protein